MRRLLVLGVIVILGSHAVFGAAIPNKHKEEETKEETKPEEQQGEDWELNLEYGRYLKEVVQALESDPEFRKKLETAEIDDIKSGKIARELHFVDHNIRTKLDELKRREVERLRHLATREHEKAVGVDRAKLKMPGHVDFKSHTRFEVEDLKRLIVKTTEDLEKVDKQRKNEFQTYEMEKEFERQQDLNALDEEHKKEAEKKHEEELKTHKEHPKLHEPGSKAQYEEVWEEQDHMKDQDFDPRTFFHLHDLDGNGYWDETELKALFLKELDKMYDPNAPEDDINERYEEMERMREHVFRESDKDKNGLISFEEFLDQTKKSEFEQDDGWKGLDEEEIYSQQEYEEYERQRQEEIARLVESGAIPPPPGYHGRPPPQAAMYQGGPNPALQQLPPQAHPQQQYAQPHPNAIPQGYGAAHPNAIPQGYQGVPQGYQAAPQGYQGAPQGYQGAPQGYQGAPQGYQGAPQGYQGAPQGYQGAPQGYQAVPQGYQAVPQGYQAVPQAVPQGSVPNPGSVPAPARGLAAPAPGIAPASPQDPAAAAAAAQPVIQQPAQQQQVQQPVGQQQPIVQQQVVQQPFAQQQPAVQPIAGQQAGQPVPLQPVAAQGQQPIAQQPPVQQQPIAQQQPVVQQQPVH